MKKAFCILLSAILIHSMLSISQPATAEEHVPLLSEMTESECLAFIKSNGITLPPLYENESSWGPFVKKYITLFENNPDAPIAISYTVTANLAQNIKTVVNRYYGTTTPLHTATKVVDKPTWLVNSELYGEWEDNFEQYNCYAYAVDYPVWVDPGQIKYIEDPSLNILDYSFNIFDVSIEDIVNLVKGDLQQLGHQRLYSFESQINTDNLCTNEKIICVRKGYEDYHFMRYASEGWLHKPGGTHILKYKYTPSDDRFWTNESVYLGHYSDGDTVYDSTIYFISYDGHNWSYSSTGSNTHTRTCTICNHTETLNCNYRYTYFYDDMHNAFCADCGNGYSGAFCTFDYTSNNNGTHTGVCACGNTRTANCYGGSYTAYLNGWHNVNCTLCEYCFGPEKCALVYTYEGFGQHMAACSKCNASHLAEFSPYHTYCGNGTDTHVHNIRCDDCEIPMYNGTESCTFSYKYNGSVNGQNTHVYTCASCGYIQFGPTQCSYIGSKPCRFCGTPKGGSVLNSLEEDFSEN